MSQLVSPDRPAHYYLFQDDQWMPFYECPKKDGRGMKAVTIREARATGAVPSVTNVLGVLAKPGLEAWKATQYIEAALTLPKLPDEPLDAYAARVVEDAETKSATARDFGTRIHKFIEDSLPTEFAQPIPDDIAPFVKPTCDWLRENVSMILGVERIVGNAKIGIAGRLDLYCMTQKFGRCIIDFKSQGIKGGKPTFYSEWGKQLAAYKACLGGEVDNALSVVVPSNVPGECYVKAWDRLDRHLELFLCCLELWKDEKGYDPAKPTDL